MTEPLPATRSSVLCAPWATLADVPDEHQALVSPEEWARLLLLASEILWALSGRRWRGIGCTEDVTVRAYPPQPGMGSWPYHATWGHCPCWPRAAAFAHGVLLAPGVVHQKHYEPVAIRLPRDHVQTVDSVTINGEPFTAWRLTGSGWLERTDGGTWQACDDSVAISYTYGQAPPEGGVHAAVALAVQLAMDAAGSDQCQLPERVTSVTRQGISMAVLDPQNFLEGGRTGLYTVDLWLSAVNPYRRGQRGRVWSPDLPTTIRS